MRNIFYNIQIIIVDGKLRLPNALVLLCKLFSKSKKVELIISITQHHFDYIKPQTDFKRLEFPKQSGCFI